MDKKQQPATDYDQPVAYDKDGRPLYAHPPKHKSGPRPQYVHMTRSLEPQKQLISPAIQLKHERSVKAYPNLNLSEGEHIILDIRRHPAGMMPVLGAGALLLTMALIFLTNYQVILSELQFPVGDMNPMWILMPVWAFIGLIVFGMYVAYYVYTSNHFYLTNESVIQEIQTSLFYKEEQTISLMNIEDASYTQQGIIQQMFNFGSIRLSTEGEETTYRFSFAPDPKGTIATLNNAVEAFKNGRPIDDNY